MRLVVKVQKAWWARPQKLGQIRCPATRLKAYEAVRYKVCHARPATIVLICCAIARLQVYDAVREEFATRGAYLLNEEEKEKVRQKVIVSGTAGLGSEGAGAQAMHCTPAADAAMRCSCCGDCAVPWAINGVCLMRVWPSQLRGWRVQRSAVPATSPSHVLELLLAAAISSHTDQRPAECRHRGPERAAAGRDFRHQGAGVGQGAGG